MNRNRVQMFQTKRRSKQVFQMVWTCPKVHSSSSVSQLQNLKGFSDVLPQTSYLYEQIKRTGVKVCTSFGFRKVDVPVLERSELYLKGLDSSEVIVGKELFQFDDRGNPPKPQVSLRPEGTAGVVKLVVNNGMLGSNLPVRVFYEGSFFRRERPQKGRLRQFNQLGVEVFNDSSPNSDLQVILMALEFLSQLKLKEEIVLCINSLGTSLDRKVYEKKLVQYLNKNLDQLSPFSQTRLETNPLRVLDSKEEMDMHILNGAPKLLYSLSSQSLLRFQTLLTYLDESNIRYTLDHRLVRGLDYYNHTIFEFKVNSSNLGSSQTTILAGGRYDGLVQKLFPNYGKANSITASIGWACGIERLGLLLQGNHNLLQPKRKILIVALIEAETFQQRQNCINQTILLVCRNLTQSLRFKGKVVVLETPFVDTNLSLTKYLKKVTCNRGDQYDLPLKIVLVGPEEVEKGLVTVKDVDSNTQVQCRLEEVDKLV